MGITAEQIGITLFYQFFDKPFFFEIAKCLIVDLKDSIELQDFLVFRLAVIVKVAVDMGNDRRKTVLIRNIRDLVQIPALKACVPPCQGV